MPAIEDKAFSDVINDIHNSFISVEQTVDDLSAFFETRTYGDMAITVNEVPANKSILHQELYHSGIGVDDKLDQIRNSLHDILDTIDFQSKATTGDRLNEESLDSSVNLERLSQEQLDRLDSIQNNTKPDPLKDKDSDAASGGLGGVLGGFGRIFSGGGLRAAAGLLMRIGGPIAAVGAFLSFASGFRNARDIVGKDDVNILERVGAGGAKLITDIVNLVTTVANWFLPESWQLGKLDAAEVYQVIARGFDIIWGFTEQLYNWYKGIVIDPFLDAFSRVRDAFSGGDSLVDSVIQAGWQFLQEIVRYPFTILNNLWDWFSNLTIVDDAVSGFREFGEGLWDMITSIPSMLLNKITEWVGGWREQLAEWSPMNIIGRIRRMLPWPLGTTDDDQVEDESSSTMFSPSELLNKLSRFLPWPLSTVLDSATDSDSSIDMDMFRPSNALDAIANALPWPFNRDSNDDEESESSDSWFNRARNRVADTYNRVTSRDFDDSDGGSRAELQALQRAQESEQQVNQARSGSTVGPSVDGVSYQNSSSQANTVNSNTVIQNNQNTIMSSPIDGRNPRSYSRSTMDQRAYI